MIFFTFSDCSVWTVSNVEIFDNFHFSIIILDNQDKLKAPPKRYPALKKRRSAVLEDLMKKCISEIRQTKLPEKVKKNETNKEVRLIARK